MIAGESFRSRWFQVGRIRLHALESGPVHGPAIVLLHGFPEFSFSWRRQLRALGEAGYRAIAPDLRGYNLSDKPASVKDYHIECLVEDVLGLIDSLPGRRAVLAGHDWGGIVAWFAGMWHSGQVERLAILNAPHPLAYLRELGRSTQLLRSWYVFFFQLPWIPEATIGHNDFALARRVYAQGPARHSGHRAEDVDTYIRALRQPRALESAINYYRAAARRGIATLRAQVRPISIPTLLIWGDRDRFLVRSLTEGLEPWVRDLRVEHLPGATHWVQHDEPERVNQLLADFLNRPARPAGQSAPPAAIPAGWPHRPSGPPFPG